MKHGYIIPLMLIATATGCAADFVPSESVGDTAQAVSSSGVAAMLSVNVSGTTYTGTLTVTNNSAEAQTNWQVLVNMGPKLSDQNKMLIRPTWLQPSGAAGVNGAYINDLGGYTLFMPTTSTNNLAAGATQTITWSGDWNNTTPTILSVDGVASGTALAGKPASSVDSTALSAATTALQIAFDYEKGKLGNNGDSNYAIYDQTIWSAQSYRVASGNGSIEFDPNAPGYAFIPSGAKADLAFAQLDPVVASYLTAGLVSCFSVTDGSMVYGFRADYLKGFVYPAAHSGSVTNGDGSVDNFSAVGSAINGRQELVTINASTGPAKPDPSFGILRYLDASKQFSNYWTAVYPKFQGGDANVGSPNPGTWHGHYAAACSPFNGPGGSSNPYFAIRQNGNSIPAWFQGVGNLSCNNGCSGSMTIDPIPYAEPGAYYDTAGNMMGTQSNPFSISGSLYAVPDHQSQWATRTINGIQEWGTFATPVMMFGNTQYKYTKQM